MDVLYVFVCVAGSLSVMDYIINELMRKTVNTKLKGCGKGELVKYHYRNYGHASHGICPVRVYTGREERNKMKKAVLNSCV